LCIEDIETIAKKEKNQKNPHKAKWSRNNEMKFFSQLDRQSFFEGTLPGDQKNS
jgi:hypothetical protein